jgi:hypothetical protein
MKERRPEADPLRNAVAGSAGPVGRRRNGFLLRDARRLIVGSTITAPASGSRAAGLGGTPTTSVRRFTSLVSRCCGLVDHIFQASEGAQVILPVAGSWLDFG